MGDWFVGYFKEVGYKVVYKVKLLQLFFNFCIILVIFNVLMKRKKIKVWLMVKYGKVYEKWEICV